MTRFDVCCAVAKTTGESLSTIRSLGFDLVPESFEETEADSPHLWLDCPFCGSTVHLSDADVEGLPEVAECSRCQTIFDYLFEEVYVADAKRIASRLLDRQMAFEAA